MNLIRLMDTPFSPDTLNIRGVMSDTDSSGRNPYFSLEGEDETEKEPKEEELNLEPDDIVVRGEGDRGRMWDGRTPQYYFSPEALCQVSESLVTAFLPFRLPLSLH